MSNYLKGFCKNGRYVRRWLNGKTKELKKINDIIDNDKKLLEEIEWFENIESNDMDIIDDEKEVEKDNEDDKLADNEYSVEIQMDEDSLVITRGIEELFGSKEADEWECLMNPEDYEN